MITNSDNRPKKFEGPQHSHHPAGFAINRSDLIQESCLNCHSYYVHSGLMLGATCILE